MNNIKSQPKLQDNVIEVRFADIILFLKKYFKSLIIASVISGITGFVFSYLLTKKYESKIILLPEYGSAKRSSFSLLAALGTDGAEKLAPDLYPTILQSTPFGLYLLQQPVTDQGNHAYKSFKLYLNREQSKPTGLFSGLFSNGKKEVEKVKKLSYDGVLSYSPDEQLDISKALALFSANVDQKSGVIEISAVTADPFVSAIAAENARKYLVNYIEDYRTSKVGQNLITLKDRVNEAKTRLRNAEVGLQSYRDKNRNTFLNVAKIEEQRLQSEYLLSQSLYNDLTGRYEQAKIDLKDEKPVFKILEPAKVPLVKSSPKRVRIALIAAFLGVLLYLAYIIFRKEKILDYINTSVNTEQEKEPVITR
jgi:uncharacterized protein involved in exopolysaccharide biosynthesis